MKKTNRFQTLKFKYLANQSIGVVKSDHWTCINSVWFELNQITESNEFGEEISHFVDDHQH